MISSELRTNYEWSGQRWKRCTIVFSPKKYLVCSLIVNASVTAPYGTLFMTLYYTWHTIFENKAYVPHWHLCASYNLILIYIYISSWFQSLEDLKRKSIAKLNVCSYSSYRAAINNSNIITWSIKIILWTFVFVK